MQYEAQELEGSFNRFITITGTLTRDTHAWVHACMLTCTHIRTQARQANALGGSATDHYAAARAGCVERAACVSHVRN